MSIIKLICAWGINLVAVVALAGLSITQNDTWLVIDSLEKYALYLFLVIVPGISWIMSIYCNKILDMLCETVVAVKGNRLIMYFGNVLRILIVTANNRERSS